MSIRKGPYCHQQIVKIKALGDHILYPLHLHLVPCTSCLSLSLFIFIS